MGVLFCIYIIWFCKNTLSPTKPKEGLVYFFKTLQKIQRKYTNNNGVKGHSPSKMKLYSCQIYDGYTESTRTLLRDFVPCYRKSDNIAGLYDTVSGTFFENQGSGDFVAGTPVE